MVRFNIEFIIDKDVCFTYWLQAIFKWSWFFGEKKAKHYRRFIKKNKLSEKIALFVFKKILQRRNNKYFWLWDRYSNKKISNIFENLLWNLIKKVFKYNFDVIWKNEEESLKKWQIQLLEYDFSLFNDALERVANFLLVKDFNGFDLKIKLLFGSEIGVSAHVKKEFPNLIILSVPSFNRENLNSVIGTIIHELIHKFEYESAITDSLFKKSYKNIIEPNNINAPSDYKWKYLLKESMLRAISSSRMNTYIGRLLTNDNEIIQKDVVKFIFTKKESINPEFLIRVVAQKIEQLTTEYLNKNMVIDEKYCDFISQVWVDLFSGEGRALG
ncbi:hypothetical protein C4565_01035 [Candidatus Parcubacteria bacterium]|jgi:hypothetical protein|nr:MAG: hypothetical protein C4565_01035 [Candidatus Parcubacteria bacterium]